MMPGLDVLARDFHFGLGSMEGAVDHPIHDSIAIFGFLLALYARLPYIVSIHCELKSPADSNPRSDCLGSRADAIHHRRRACIATRLLGNLDLSVSAD